MRIADLVMFLIISILVFIGVFAALWVSFTTAKSRRDKMLKDLDDQHLHTRKRTHLAHAKRVLRFPACAVLRLSPIPRMMDSQIHHEP